MFQKHLRFRMMEYQVRWKKNMDEKTQASQPNNVEIVLFKNREIILKRKNE